MDIGIDATCWWNNRGFGRFTRELLAELFQLESDHRFHLFTDQPIPEAAAYANVDVHLVNTSRPCTEAAVVDDNRSPLDMLRMSRAVSAVPLDVMFFPAVYSWYPVPPRLPTMVTVMDAIAEHYPKLIFPGWRSRFFWTLKMKGAIWNSDRILTISNAARDEIVQYIGVSAQKIDVCSAAPTSAFDRVTDPQRLANARISAGIPADLPYIIYVGGLAPHKNLHGLLDGFEKALQNPAAATLQLALVGDYNGAGFHSNYESLLARVQSNPQLTERVHFTGYVSDDELVALYSDSLAAAMPSFSEGFGLPVIEALACGTPVLSSELGSLPEVAGDAGVYFDPFSADSIAAAIVQVASDSELRQRLAENGTRRAQEFTWHRAARLTLGYLQNMGPS
ncbi:MAG: glycosyltransferase family 4 protein [Gammaproteobacteria bacterium]|nr:glycosyltransferase family 4 protein [Gammaproteobacteria bacterium]